MEPAPKGAHSRYLAAGEVAKLQVRRHVVVLLRPFVETVAVIAGASALGAVVTPRTGSHPLDTLLGLVALVAVARFLYLVLAWWLDRIVVTDQRLFEVSGLLTKKVAVMPLAKLTDLTFTRTPLGRLLGYGDLVLETAGQEQALTHLERLPNPEAFYRAFSTLVMARFSAARPDVEADEHGGAGPPIEEEDIPWPDDDDTGPLPHVIV
jgi:membrane protein YdbS with pleckstrin-like domain